MSIELRNSQYGAVFGHWRICEFLGQGSEGKSAVFRLEHCESEGVYSALKVISLIEERGEIQALNAYQKREYAAARNQCTDIARQEVLLMNTLQGNTNIVDYLDHTVVDWADDTGFGRDMLIRMELLKDLRSLMRRGKIFSEREVLKIGRDICSALVLCHRNNILHRDIKPENIFISKTGHCKLGDFGVSRILSAAPMSTASTSVGTPQYAAPEQFFGHHDHRIDIYSLGLVLYELSNQNRLPFATSSYILPDDVQRRFSGEPLPLPCDASAEFAEVILKACAFNPEDRFQTAQEFLNALQLVTETSAGNTPDFQTIHRPTSLHPSYATVAAAPAEFVPKKRIYKKFEIDETKRETYLEILLSVLILCTCLIILATFKMVKRNTASERRQAGSVPVSMVPTTATSTVEEIYTKPIETIASTAKQVTAPTTALPKENVAVTLMQCGIFGSRTSNTPALLQLQTGTEVEVVRYEPIGSTQWVYIKSDSPVVSGWTTANMLDMRNTQFYSDVQADAQSAQQTQEVSPQTQAFNNNSTISGYIVNADGGLNVRATPSATSRIVRRVYNGDCVSILEKKYSEGMEWGRISDGWICMAYFSTSNNTSGGNTSATVITGTVSPSTDALNVRNGPGTSFDAVARIPSGGIVRIYEQKNVNGTNWGRIDSGWVCMDYIVLSSNNSTTQSTKTTFVYSVEGQRREVAATIQNNTGYSIAIPDENWYFNHQSNVDSWQYALLHQVVLYVYRPNNMSRDETIKDFVQNHREYDFQNLSNVYSGTGSSSGSSLSRNMYCTFSCTKDGWLVAWECTLDGMDGWVPLLREMAASFSPQ